MDEAARRYRQALGKVTRSARLTLRLSQEAVGLRMGRTQQEVSNIERGMRAPTDIEALAAALELTYVELARRVQACLEK